ncbi:hypothetical protein TI39_contig278g00042 [Zymoseptoria brevis]|uniref:Uncharacterized protein n=1 Tax=Zymoseptoria brevis TaxID=1047168 RepID=A0A0F4GXN2_9PEZI|nr:hypothetical protein TI39_contig278g00042 [Zymoseptoria brevis]
MAYYDNDNSSWSAQGRQPSWENQQRAPSRSATSSAMSQRYESSAFASQFEEIERATDNLIKSGKWYPGQAQGGAGGVGAGARREGSIPAAGRNFDFSSADPRLGGGPSRNPSVSDFDAARPSSAGLQGFYAGQRFPGGRQSEAEQVLQAKRRMAAQRERELRNYHQEQQYNRKTVSSSKASTDRSNSPAAMSEEDRRELIARQHRALYGENSSMYNADGTRAQGPDVRSPSDGRGPSPLAHGAFGKQVPSSVEGSVQMPPRDRAENTTSPVSHPPSQQFGLIHDSQSNRQSSSSPGASPPLVQGQGQKGGAGAVAPIGTRPPPGAGNQGAMNKRATTPLTPSSLSYGFNANDGQNANANNVERTTSGPTNPGMTAEKNVSGLGNWGSSSGGWGSGKNNLAVQPSVWG